MLKNLKREQKDFNKLHSNLENKEKEIRNKFQELEKKIHGSSERRKEIKRNLERLEGDGLSMSKRKEKLNKISLGLEMFQQAVPLNSMNGKNL